MKLYESPTTDVMASRKADMFLRQALAELYSRAAENPEMRCPIIDYAGPEDISLMFVGSEIGGGQTSEDAFGGYRISIGIGVGVQRTVAAAINVLETEMGSTIFRHEFQHAIDLARHKKTLTPPYDSEKVASGSASSQEMRRYYNNPVEYNAYFHNIAEPLLRILRLAEEHGIADAKETSQPIDADFIRYYQQMVWNMQPGLSKMITKMDPAYRKKMMKRLYVLHHAAVEIVGGSDKDGRSLVVKIMARVRRLLKGINAI